MYRDIKKDIVKEPPAGHSYYSALRSAYEDGRYVLLIKATSFTLSVVALSIGVTAIGLGSSWGYQLLWAALLVSVCGWVIEVITRRQRGQEQHLKDVKQFEVENKLPPTYEELPPKFWGKLLVVLPHLLTFIISLILLVLWRLGMF